MEDQLALVRAEPPGELVAMEYHEPIADMNLNRKKMTQLEQGMHSLQRAARQNNEVVSSLESGMKAMISESDLRRSIGLAFQEFEQRLEDAFTDSNRKCLAMFSKRDEVSELQVQIGKKVNWSDFNSVMKKLADLRQYIDTMAESVFMGHREALNGEFAKKADKAAIEQALAVKADNDDVRDVRARLERLEVLVAHTDARQTDALETLREEVESKRRELAEQHSAMISRNAADIAKLKGEHSTFLQRLTKAESELQATGKALEQVRDGMLSLQKQQDAVIMPTIDAMQGRLDRVDGLLGQTQQNLRSVESDVAAVRESTQRTTEELRAQVNANNGHVEFLLEEFDMMKRRSQERHKKNATGLQELTDGQEQLSQQLKSIERDLKRQGRDVRAIENRTLKAADETSALAGLRALPAPPTHGGLLLATAGDPPTDAGDRLRGMLEQIEKIAMGGPAPEHTQVPYNPERPPLPFASPRPPPIAATGIEGLPRFNKVDAGALDSARSMSSASVKSMYGLSPRVAPPGAKAGKPRR